MMAAVSRVGTKGGAYLQLSFGVFFTCAVDWSSTMAGQCVDIHAPALYRGLSSKAS